MRILNRYLGREVLVSILVVFAGLLMLFAFFDLIRELDDVGKGRYSVGRALLFVALHLPGRLYELFPIAALIGTLFALSQLVASSEYTVMRTSGSSLTQIAWALVRVGVLLVVATFAVGELVAPPSERLAQQTRIRATDPGGPVVAAQFRSGFWFKQNQTFVNVRNLLPDGVLLGVRVFVFDPDYRLVALRTAEKAEFVGEGKWRLVNVTTTELGERQARTDSIPEMNWESPLRPSILNVYQVAPEKLELDALVEHIQMLSSNQQRTSRFEVALWTKIFYPVSVLVLMLLALPFAYFQRRTGGVGFRVFLGIMLGLTFFLLNRLFGYMGLLNDWPPFFSAVFPIATFLAGAAALLWYLERR